jgi:hypothetical protein
VRAVRRGLRPCQQRMHGAGSTGARARVRARSAPPRGGAALAGAGGAGARVSSQPAAPGACPAAAKAAAATSLSPCKISARRARASAPRCARSAAATFASPGASSASRCACARRWRPPQPVLGAH